MLNPKIESALNHLYEKRPKQAADIFDQHNDEVVKDAELAKSAGFAYEFSNQIGKALLMYQASLTLDSEQDDLKLRLADIFNFLGRFEEASNYYREQFGKSPDNADLGFKTARTLIDSGNPVPAITVITRLHKIKPKTPQFYLLEARALMALKQTDAAEHTLALASKLGQDDTSIAYRKAELLQLQGQFGEAIEQFALALRFQPQLPEAYAQQATCSLMLNDPKRAKQYLADGIARSPDHLQLANAQANLAKELGEDIYATHLIKNLDSKKHASLVFAGLQCLEQLSDYDRIEAFWASNPAEAAAAPSQLIRARRCLAENQFESALEIIKTLPTSKALRSVQAQALMGLGRYQEAYDLMKPILNGERIDQLDLAILLSALRFIDEEKYLQIVDIESQVIEVDLADSDTDIGQLNNQLLAELSPMHFAANSPLAQSVKGGTQTPGDLFEHNSPAISRLRTLLSETVLTNVGEEFNKTLANQHPLKRSISPYINSAWSIKTTEGGSHISHVHSRGWYSSAYYVSVPNEVSEGNGGELVLGVPSFFTPDTVEPLAVITPKAGHLVLFPSYLWHQTNPFKSDSPRVVVAFDVI